jgi:dTDP-4-dehydrorhamnose reductase
MAQGAQSQHAVLIHFSTDYVFDGEKGRSYVEGDSPNPKNVYGQTKLAGEIAVQSSCESFLILRTSWLYSMRLTCFPTNVLDWSRKQEIVRVVDDQVGSPTWCRVLAEITGFLIARANGDPYEYFQDRKGLYHVAGKGSASRYDWAQAILLNDPHPEEQIMRELQRAESSDFQTSAKRPPNSSLDCTLFQETFKLQIPGWEETLQLAMDGAG